MDRHTDSNFLARRLSRRISRSSSKVKVTTSKNVPSGYFNALSPGAMRCFDAASKETIEECDLRCTQKGCSFINSHSSMLYEILSYFLSGKGSVKRPD